MGATGLPNPKPSIAAGSRPRACTAAALLLALAACAGDPPAPAPAFDLGENLAFARVTRETAGIDLGTTGDEEHLGAGWSHRESERRSGRTFRWGLEPLSEIVLTVLEPRAVTLRLEGRPRAAPAGSPQAVEVEINGRAAGRLELRAGRQVHALDLPPDLLQPGANRLRLRYDLGGPGAVPAGEERAIAVAWYGIGVSGVWSTPGEPRLDAERELLFIPYGSRLDYYLRAPAAAVLRSARRRFVAGEGTLAVRLGRDSASERLLAALAGPGDLEVALPAAAGEPIRLSLAAVATEPAGDGGGVVLEAPVVWADAPPAPATEPPAAAPAGGRRANLVVYLVDTLRADRLGCYGHTRMVSPRIDRFAAGATLFENARAQSPWTLPSVASVMTGLWPPAHGVFEDTRRLAPEALTLAEALRDAGYQTAAVVTNGFATGDYGLDQGFDELTLIKGGESRLAHDTALAWLETRDPERPFFLYLHTLDPHQPYLPPEELRRRFAPESEALWQQIVAEPARQHWEPSAEVVAQLLALYDAEIAQNDASFGATLDALERAGLYEDALIVFLSDHGEEFYEHQAWTHASNLYREALNVPLIVKLPGQQEGRRVAELAQHIDLMPTLLGALGIGEPPTQDRLLPSLPGAAASPSRRVFSHTRRKGQTTASVIDGDWKLIRRADGAGVRSQLYNWREDPRERHDHAAERPVLAGLLTAAIQRHLAESVPPGVAAATPGQAVLDNLRALGYID